MASAFARSGGRVIASAAAVLSSHFPSSINQQADNNTNDLEPGAIQNPPFRQLSSKEVDDVARTIFVGKNESNHNNNNNTTTNNPNPTSSASSTSSSIQVHHHSLNPLALALGQQLAEDPKIQQSLYEHMREKWSMIAKGGTGVEKEINLSDAEEEEWSINSPMISDIEGDDWSHLSRNQLVLSPELFAMAHQALPSHASNDAEGMPSHNHHNNNDANHHHHQQQQQSSSSSTSTDSKNNHHHPNNPHPENKTEEEVGILDRFVRWVGSLFNPQQQPSEEGIAQQNHPHQSSASNAPPAAAPTSTPSRLKSLLGNIEIYQMALAVAAVIVFVAIFRRPPPRF